MTCSNILKQINSFVADSVTFQAPSPSTYSINIDENHNVIFYQKSKTLNQILKVYPWVKGKCYNIKNKKNKIVLIELLLLKNESMLNKKRIIFSHGNACDLGMTLPLMIDFCQMYECDVYAYDYSGYGCSTGKPSEEEISNNLSLVIDFLKETKEIDTNIILYGNSLGSSPVIDYVNRTSKGIIGIILLSPIASGLKIAFNGMSKSYKEYDVFNNDQKVNDISTPVYIIHGKLDKLIKIADIQEMAKSLKSRIEWYPDNGNHNNIISKYRYEYYQKTKSFIDQLEFEEKSSLVMNNLDNDLMEKGKFSSHNDKKGSNK